MSRAWRYLIAAMLGLVLGWVACDITARVTQLFAGALVVDEQVVPKEMDY